MTEDRLNEITRDMAHSPLHWAMRWCEARATLTGCACLGCADTATRADNRLHPHPEIFPHTIEPITKEEWREWWRIQGERLGAS